VPDQPVRRPVVVDEPVSSEQAVWPFGKTGTDVWRTCAYDELAALAGGVLCELLPLAAWCHGADGVVRNVPATREIRGKSDEQLRRHL
jgi:hypothetical protein